jgi:hypothetical protein
MTMVLKNPCKTRKDVKLAYNKFLLISRNKTNFMLRSGTWFRRPKVPVIIWSFLPGNVGLANDGSTWLKALGKPISKYWFKSDVVMEINLKWSFKRLVLLLHPQHYDGTVNKTEENRTSPHSYMTIKWWFTILQVTQASTLLLLPCIFLFVKSQKVDPDHVTHKSDYRYIVGKQFAL